MNENPFDTDTYVTCTCVYYLLATWRIGTELGSEDVFPATEVSFGGAMSARISGRTLYLDNVPFASLDEIFSLAEVTAGVPVTDQMAIEPGRLYYHTVQFCSFAHKCVDVMSRPGIVIRKLWPQNDTYVLEFCTTGTKDNFRVSGIGEDITLTINQFRSRGDIVAVVDRTYDIVIKTTNGKVTVCVTHSVLLAVIYCRCTKQRNINGRIFKQHKS